MISITQVNNAALSSGSVDVRKPSTPVARQPVGSASGQSGQVNKQQQQPSAQEVQQAVAQANAQMAGLNENISFGFVQQLGQLVVQVKDQGSGEVIRQFPSKEFIAQQIAGKEFLGQLLDKQA